MSAEIHNEEAQIAETKDLSTALAHGFCTFEIQHRDHLKSIQKGIHSIGAHSGFRFPPINVDFIEYDEIQREAFKALFSIAIEALVTIGGVNENECAEMDSLFSESKNEPFPLGHLYHSTFFNLFNYDHGSLNEHQDRGLLTVIYVEPAPRLNEENPPSELWIKGPDETWRSGDQVIRTLGQTRPNQAFVILLIGEDGEAYFNQTKAKQSLDYLFAAAHCVRANPQGDFIEWSHHRCDPDSRPFGNRKSAALILNDD